MITQERLKELLHYDPETGVLTWTKATSNRIAVGDVAGNIGVPGYIDIRVDGVLYKAHRLAVLWMTGSFPEADTDHINGMRADNRWVNLRCVPRLINGQNHRKADVDSRTGVLGVTKSGNRFKAQIGACGKNYYLGCFGCPELAHAAYIKAKRDLHPGGTL